MPADTWLDKVINRTYLILGVGVLLLGVLFIAFAFNTLSPASGFLSGSSFLGLAFVLLGVLNLVHWAYGRVAPGLRGACVAMNLLITPYAIWIARVWFSPPLGLAIVVGLFGGTAALSLLRRSLRGLS